MTMEQTVFSETLAQNSETEKSPKRKNTTKYKMLTSFHNAVSNGLLKEHIILQKHLQNATTSNETKNNKNVTANIQE